MEEVELRVPVVDGSVLVQGIVNEVCTAVREYIDTKVPAAVHAQVYDAMTKALDTQFVETMTTALAHSDWFREWIETNLRAFLRVNGEQCLRQWFDNSLVDSNIHADITSIVRSELATQINNMLRPEVQRRVADHMHDVAQRMAMAMSAHVVPGFNANSNTNYK